MTRLYAPITIPGVVRGGAPLTLDRAIEVLGMLVQQQEQNARAYDRAFAHYERVKRPATKAKYRAAMRAGQREHVRLTRAVERLENQVNEYVSELPQRVPEPIVSPTRPRRREPRAVEWQYGLKYTAARRGGHNVDLNVNVRRRDGRMMPESEARDALAKRIRTGEFPSAYEWATVLYRSPDSGSARGRTFRAGDLTTDELDAAFDAVISSTNIHDWRLGGIEP